MRETVLAWSAHAYTALGLVCAAGMAPLLVRGGDGAFRATFLLMAVATLIDGTDGWLARHARVSEVTPGFDGRRLDDLIDFLTYTCLPLVLIWRAGLLGDASPWWLLVPLVASAYGFCQTQAKTDDHFFLGFPSYWNVVAFYLYVIGPPGAWALAVVLAFALLTFVPARYLYLTRGGPMATVTNLLGMAWVVSVAATLWLWQGAPRALIIGSLGFPAYYLGLSWLISVRHWRGRGEAQRGRDGVARSGGDGR